MLKLKKKSNNKIKTRLFSGIVGLVAILLICSALANVFATTSDYFYDSANVSLNGVDGGTAYMYLRTVGGGTFYTMQGDFSINETNDDDGYITLSSLMAAGSNGSTSIANFDAEGFRRLLHSDSNYDGNVINSNNPIMIAVYDVDKDTPAGDYTVSISNISVTGGTSGFDGEHLPNMVGTIHVTRTDTPAQKPTQTILFKDEDENVITSVTKHYGDAPFVVNVIPTEGTVAEYHPMDGPDDEHVVVTDPGSNLVTVGVVGEVEVCARVEETENYAETTACYTATVTRRPLDIVGAVIADKTYDGTTDATVTSVSFEDVNLNAEDYTATATFEEADAGENVVVHVSVELTEGAAANYVLNASNYDTTKTISPFQLTASNITLSSGNTYAFVPGGVEPGVTVVVNTHGGDTTLVEGEDYEVAYSDNLGVGTGHATVTGINNYMTVDPIVLDFTIEARGINLSNLVAPDTIVEGYVLSESDIDINVDGVDLVRCGYDGQTNCDYVLEISGDNDGVVGNIVHVAAEGRNNYTGVAVKDIEVVAKLAQTVSFEGVTGDIDKVYGDAKFTYTATTTGDGEITYVSANTSVATVDLHSGEVTIVGVGVADIIATAAETDDYAEASAGYRINVSKKTVTISSVTVSNKAYDGGTAATVTAAVLSDDDLLLGDGFSIDEAHFTSANVGDYDDVYVRIKLDDDAYTFYQFAGEAITAETTGSATIQAFTLSADNATETLSSTSYTYDGEAKEPTATVMVDLDGDGTKETSLTAGTDYEIAYDSNTNTGTATATITGKGNYTGSLPALEFTISAAPVENVVVTAPAQTYTGEALEPVPTVTGTVNGEQVTFTTADYYIIEHDNFINAGDYTFGVASGMNSNYYIPITNGTFTISKAESGEPENTPSDFAAEVGNTLADLGDLPEGFTWVDDTTVVAAGMNNYAATYTKNGDTENYNTVNVNIPVLGYTAEYEFIAGAGQEYVIGESESALFEIDADFELFEDDGKVYVDNELVEPANYEARDGSTIIEFTKEYMDGLALGEHSLSVLFNDGGVARTTFTVANPVAPEDDEPEAADTGVFTSVTGGAVATGFTLVVVAIIAGVAYKLVKKNKEA